MASFLILGVVKMKEYTWINPKLAIIAEVGVKEACKEVGLKYDKIRVNATLDDVSVFYKIIILSIILHLSIQPYSRMCT